MKEIACDVLFEKGHTVAEKIFEGVTYPYEVLPKISEFILELGKTLPADKFECREDNIWIAKSASVAPSAYIHGPAIIDEEAEIRHCAFIRGNAIVGKGAVVGNSTELKNVILFDKVQVPHYNYVGDSVLGFKSHMGAGSITSNVKSDKTLVVIKSGEEKIETGLKKMGAILGDCVEVGCGSNFESRVHYWSEQQCISIVQCSRSDTGWQHLQKTGQKSFRNIDKNVEILYSF